MFLMSAVFEFCHAALELKNSSIVAIAHILHWASVAGFIWIEHKHLEDRTGILKKEKEFFTTVETFLQKSEKDEPE
jgi:hypothetical protein